MRSLRVACAAASGRQAYRRRSTASATSSAPAQNPDRNCWRDRISKARTSRAGSMGRLASSMRSKPPASSIRIRTSTAPSKSQRGATRKAISAVPRQQVLCRRRHRGGHRRRARPQQRPRPCATPCARPGLPAGRASRPNAGGTSDISRRISSKARRLKAAPQHRRRHLHRRHLAIPDHFHRRAKSCRHDPDGRSQGCRPGAGQSFAWLSTIGFPRACGPRTVWTTGRITLDPGAPSIIPGSAEMLFQIRDDDPDVIDAWRICCETWRRRSAHKAAAASRWSAFAPAPLP